MAHLKEIPYIRNRCPFCNSLNNRVIKTARRNNRIIRYHECECMPGCGAVFRTYELLAITTT